MAYDITQVDVPGLLSIYRGAQDFQQSQQDRRLNQMLIQRKIAAEDRELQKQNTIADIYRKLQPPSAAGGQNAGAPAPQVAGPAVIAPSSAPSALMAPYAAPSDGIDRNRPTGSPLSPMTFPSAPSAPTPPVGPQGASTAPASMPQPPASWVAANKGILDQLLTIDPPEYFKLQTQLQGMDDASIKKTQSYSKIMGQVGLQLSSFPTVEGRRQFLARIAPQLVAEGIPQDAIDKADLSDAGVQWLQIHAQDLDKSVTRALDDRKQAEVERHNREEESIGRANVSVREGALGVAKAREGRAAQGGGKSTSGSVDPLDFIVR